MTNNNAKDCFKEINEKLRDITNGLESFQVTKTKNAVVVSLLKDDDTSLSYRVTNRDSYLPKEHSSLYHQVKETLALTRNLASQLYWMQEQLEEVSNTLKTND